MRLGGERQKLGPGREEDGWHSWRLPNPLSCPGPLRRGGRLWARGGWAPAQRAGGRGRLARAAGKSAARKWEGRGGARGKGRAPWEKGRGRLQVDRTEEVVRPRRGRSPWKVGGARTRGGATGKRAGLKRAQLPPEGKRSPEGGSGAVGPGDLRGGGRGGVRRGGGGGSAEGRASAGRGGDVQVVRVLDGGRVVLRHLDGDVAGDVGGAAAAAPRLGLQKLARVVGAVAESRTVEGRVGTVHLLLRVALGEQVHGHHASPLWQRMVRVPEAGPELPRTPRLQTSQPLLAQTQEPRPPAPPPTRTPQAGSCQASPSGPGVRPSATSLLNPESTPPVSSSSWTQERGPPPRPLSIWAPQTSPL